MGKNYIEYGTQNELITSDRAYAKAWKKYISGFE